MDAYDENKDSRTVYRHSKCNWFQNQKLWMTCSIWSVDIFKNFLQHNALLQKTLPKELDRAGTFPQKEMKEKNPLDACLQSYHVIFMFFKNSIIVYLCLHVKYKLVYTCITLLTKNITNSVKRTVILKHTSSSGKVLSYNGRLNILVCQ